MPSVLPLASTSGDFLPVRKNVGLRIKIIGLIIVISIVLGGLGILTY